MRALSKKQQEGHSVPTFGIILLRRSSRPGGGACWRTLLLPAALLSLVLAVAVAGRAEGFIYWADSNSIKRANPDGTGFGQKRQRIEYQNFIRTPPKTCGVAVDANHVYWGSRRGGIGRANLDGSEADPDFITEAESPSTLAVDGSHVYWASDGASPGSIGRANLDGTDANQHFITGLGGTQQVAVGATHIYWADAGGGIVGRANLDGSDVNPHFLVGAKPHGVGVDVTHVYWSNRRDQRWRDIGRADLDGIDIDQSFISRASRGPARLAVSAAPAGRSRGHRPSAASIYWTNPKTRWIGGASLDGRIVMGLSTFDRDPPPCGISADPLRSLSLGNARKKRNRRGTTILTVNVPDAGQVRLARTNKVKGARARARSAGRVTLPITPRGRTKRRLEAALDRPPWVGRARVRVRVTYTPNSADPTIVANTVIGVVTLVRRNVTIHR
jgi:virginiamycin B lyase